MKRVEKMTRINLETYHGDNRVTKLDLDRFNMLQLSELFETKKYVHQYFDLSRFDEIDKATITLSIYELVCFYVVRQLDLTLDITVAFSSEVFIEKVNDFIENYETSGRKTFEYFIG